MDPQMSGRVKKQPNVPCGSKSVQIDWFRQPIRNGGKFTGQVSCGAIATLRTNVSKTNRSTGFDLQFGLIPIRNKGFLKMFNVWFQEART